MAREREPELKSARACAYCATADTPLTREHLWPTAMHKRRLDAEEEEERSDWGMWVAKIGKDLKSEQTIRDVCASCNNGVLSELDSYACRLFDEYFARNLEKDELVRFCADYHSLKRWLLKLCFNSARISQSVDLMVFPPLLPYIRGESDAVGRSVQLYVALQHPGEIPAEHRPEAWPAERPFCPTGHRLGQLFFRAPDGREKLLRAVHLRGFSFFLAFFDPSGPRSDEREFSRVFLHGLPAAVLLRKSSPCVDLRCEVDAWQIFAGARANRIVGS